MEVIFDDTTMEAPGLIKRRRGFRGTGGEMDLRTAMKVAFFIRSLSSVALALFIKALRIILLAVMQSLRII